MKILVACLEHDYGVAERGPSYEYLNVYQPLRDVWPGEVVHFDFLAETTRLGQRRMNRRLWELGASERPDLALFCLFRDELDPEVMDRLRHLCPTVAYFFDDPWRQEFVRRWIPHFDHFTTSDPYLFRRYRAEGLLQALHCPFGFNASLYRKLDLPARYEVSFVGGYSPLRAHLIHKLASQGISVEVFGRGWESGRPWLSPEQMIEVFNVSRINLNLSNAVSTDLGLLLWSLRSLRALSRLAAPKHREQVKGRHYEINGCGGFQLSCYVPGLNLVYEIDREIAVFDQPGTMAELIAFYLRDEELRQAIARRGHERSLREHTAQNYLRRMVEQVLDRRGASAASKER